MRKERIDETESVRDNRRLTPNADSNADSMQKRIDSLENRVRQLMQGNELPNSQAGGVAAAQDEEPTVYTINRGPKENADGADGSNTERDATETAKAGSTEKWSTTKPIPEDSHSMRQGAIDARHHHRGRRSSSRPRSRSSSPGYKTRDREYKDQSDLERAKRELDEIKRREEREMELIRVHEEMDLRDASPDISEPNTALPATQGRRGRTHFPRRMMEPETLRAHGIDFEYDDHVSTQHSSAGCLCHDVLT